MEYSRLRRVVKTGINSYYVGMIHAIQHVGIGVKNLDVSWQFYRELLHFDVPLSRNQSEAARMGSLTDGVQQRKVIIALNLLGGGLIEIFQFTTKDPKPAPKVEWGNIGFLSFTMKVLDIEKAYRDFMKSGVDVLIPPSMIAPSEDLGWKHMYFRDPECNLLALSEMPEMSHALRRKGANIGGISYPTIGVSDMNVSLPFYRDLLGYQKVVYDWSGIDPCMNPVLGSERSMRRVLLARGRSPSSLFRYYLLDGGMLELVEVAGAQTNHIYAGRGWGDQGIMELCLDVSDIAATFNGLVKNGAQSVIEPNEEDFAMDGDSSALFAYVSDPDGTWIELAEIVSFPVFGGLKFDLRKRRTQKPLSPVILSLLRFARASG